VFLRDYATSRLEGFHENVQLGKFVQDKKFPNFPLRARSVPICSGCSFKHIGQSYPTAKLILKSINSLNIFSFFICFSISSLNECLVTCDITN